MIQRFEPAALSSELMQQAAEIERVMPAAGSVLALPFGEVAGDFRATGRAGKRRRAIYELLIANDTASPIATFAYALDGPLQSRVTWDAIIVPAHSAVAVDIEVPVSPSGARPRMIAEVYTHESKLVLDAKNDAGVGRGVVRRIVATFAGLAVIATGSLAYASIRPHVAALAAPPAVQSGATFDVAYDAHGTSADYTVATPDGTQIAAGSLDPRAGSFSVALPRADVSLGYDVSVVAHGALGTDERSVHVVALALTPPPVAVAKTLAPPTVTHVSLASDTVEGGQPIVVRYRSNVRTGNVRLIDQYGTVRGEALLSGRGRSTLVAPYVDADQDLRVVVSAERGNARASSAVPITIRHVDPQTADATAARGTNVPPPVAPAAAAAAETTTQTAPATPAAAPPAAKVAAPKTNADAAEPVVALPGPPISVEAHQLAGQPVRVRILRHDAGLHLSMMGPDGNELISENVPSGTTMVLLQAPDPIANGGKGYSIVATYASGVGEETVIRSIVFAR
jgi:hypothetical protein